MHIGDAILSMPVLAVGTTLTVAGIAMGLRKINADNLPKVAVMTATFFIASFIHFNVGPTTVHLMLNGLIGLMLGWAAFPVVFVGLLIQAILFQFGGLTTLGVNTLNVAGPAVLFGLLFRNMVLNDNPKVSSLGAFLTGALALGLTSVMVAIALLLSGSEKEGLEASSIIQDNFLTSSVIPVQLQVPALVQMFFHAPVMILEGLIALFCVRFLKKVKPELLSDILGDQTVTPSTKKDS